MKRSTICVLLATGAIAAACATMSDTECRAANWYEIGERDALVYGIQPQIEQLAHQCSRHGLQASEKDYIAGWLVGQGERIRRSAGEGCCPAD